ncbi:Astacin (Peptidase M12A) [Parelaphostrongylus tenuis]|uniref:Metalloendopeptidase n=1 Tax=Parelaphostrongylus tenuis TaxID=148309 RepID=A0AAD5MF41_PARTN|nr:Astacin (Peptidase M12A) [Parelaphostrongylus tenuis]
MIVLLLLFHTFCTGVDVSHNAEVKNGLLSINENFEAELEQGYQLLEDEADAYNTKMLIQQLHDMEPEIKQQFALSPERKAELEGAMKIGLAVHELGHALGFYHMHSRHDRDDFITVNEENLRKGFIIDYTKESEQFNYNYNVSYDYGGVMHYGAYRNSRFLQPSGCGEILTADYSYKILEAVAGEDGDFGRYGRDEYMMCNHWIQVAAMRESKSKLEATSATPVTGRSLATGNRHTSSIPLFRFCSPEYVRTTLVSTHNIVPVITYSNVHKVTIALLYRIGNLFCNFSFKITPATNYCCTNVTASNSTDNTDTKIGAARHLSDIPTSNANSGPNISWSIDTSM